MKIHLKFTVLLFCLFVQFVFSQDQKKIDSLHVLIKSASSIEKVTLYGELFSLYINKTPDKAKPYLDSIAKYIEFDKRKIDSAFYNRNLARYFNRIEDNSIAKKYILKSTEQFESLNLKKEVAENYNNIGVIELKMGNLDSASENLIKSLKLKDELGYTEAEKRKTYSLLGGVFGNLKNYQKSIEYFKLVERNLLDQGDTKNLAYIWNNLAVNYKNLDSLEKALLYYKKSIENYESRNAHNALALSYSNLGNLYIQLDSLDLVMPLYEKALKSAKISNNSLELARTLNNIGAFYNVKKEYNKALAPLLESHEMNLKANRKVNLRLNYKSIAEAYAGLKKYKEAYNYKVFEKKYSDSIFNEESLQKINELEKKYQTEKKEAEIALQKQEINTLNAKVKIDKLTKGLYAGGMFSFVAVSGLLFFGFRQRMKKKRIEYEKQQEIYRQEIEFKKKELASQTLHLVQKNTFLQELKENLENLRNSPEKFKMEFRRIVMLLKKENASDKDWEVFKSYFSEVHDNFDKKLRNIYNDISEKELRLASFIRMNLSTKEIAAMLNVMPESIFKSKYRLKQKLNLDKGTDLYTFLLDL